MPSCWCTSEGRTATWLWTSTRTSTAWSRPPFPVSRAPAGWRRDELSPARAPPSSSPGSHADTRQAVNVHCVGRLWIWVWLQRGWQSWRLTAALQPKFCAENDRLCRWSEWTKTRWVEESFHRCTILLLAVFTSVLWQSVREKGGKKGQTKHLKFSIFFLLSFSWKVRWKVFKR